jgi:hypothetical protein
VLAWDCVHRHVHEPIFVASHSRWSLPGAHARMCSAEVASQRIRDFPQCAAGSLLVLTKPQVAHGSRDMRSPPLWKQKEQESHGCLQWRRLQQCQCDCEKLIGESTFLHEQLPGQVRNLQQDDFCISFYADANAVLTYSAG